MILVIDVGNTNIVLGLYKESTLLASLARQHEPFCYR